MEAPLHYSRFLSKRHVEPGPIPPPKPPRTDLAVLSSIRRRKERVLSVGNAVKEAEKVYGYAAVKESVPAKKEQRDQRELRNGIKEVYS